MIDPVGTRPRLAEEDEQAVRRFADDMTGKLQANAHKAHWSTVTTGWLFARLIHEVSELGHVLDDGTPAMIRSECADIANFAMMISENHR